MDQPSLVPVICQEPPEPIHVPTSRWLLTVYSRDILSRLDHIKASITSTFGSILKMDSTKKVRNNLTVIYFFVFNIYSHIHVYVIVSGNIT